MAKDKKEKREEKMKKKGMLKMKPEKKFKKRKALNEGGVNLAMDESERGPAFVKDSEGSRKSGKSGKNASTEMKKKTMKEKMMPKFRSSSEANNEEEISANIEEKTVSPRENASTKIKKKKSKDKKMPKLKSTSKADNEEEISAKIEENPVSPGDDFSNHEESNDVSVKKPEKGKKKGKDQISKKKAAQSDPKKQELKVKKKIHSQPEKKVSKTKISEKSSEMDEENAEEISSVDEDCSRGMKKWLMEYKESMPGIDVLQQRIDDFITDHEAKLEQEKQEREAAAAEGGWTVVVHQKGRKKTTDAESGISVGSVAPAAVLDKMSKKKGKESTMDFYRFQRREAQRSEIMMLQEKFEQDKKRIQQLRAARKFRPY